jgi:MFS family permease
VKVTKESPQTTWAPLRHKVFRWLWLASMVSNVGTWMQGVGAQWFLVHAAHAAILVSLVQTADMLPDVLFGLVGGVLADILDRRRLLIAVQIGMVVATSLLAALTIAGKMTPALLLLFTFVIGMGSVVGIPAYQSLVPELVPRDQIPAAAQLSSININLARAIGPAIAGILIASIGVGGVFALDAATFLVYGLAAALWRPGTDISTQIPERFTSALRAGGRYIRYAPVVRRILFRTSLFLVPASALWALLPLVASRRLELGSTGYGLLLAALGVGAITGAIVLARVRRWLSSNSLIGVTGAVFAAALATVVLVRSTVVVFVVLILAGMAWVGMLATVNTLLQLFLPSWVRARGLSVYQMVLFGAQGAGALVWGLVADAYGLTLAFLVAAGLTVAGAASIRIWPFVDTSRMDRRNAFPSDPGVQIETEASSGPVVVRTTFFISAERQDAFTMAMDTVRQSRLRTGAIQWGLVRNGERPGEFEELYVVASWDEHLRQHSERATGTDLRYLEQAIALSDPAPQSWHLLPVEQAD